MEKQDQSTRKTLDDYGIIFISGEIAPSICERIIQINVEQQADFIQLIINSQGGSCSAGFAIIDMMEWSRIPVYTTGVGLVASMALCIFMAGEKGHRVLTPRTSILSHRFSAFSLGNHSELIAKRKEEDLMHNRILQHYRQHTELNSDEDITGHLLRDTDTWLSPQEAVDMGIADKIQQDRKTLVLTA
jgi:ATP-dependent Clp protease protease subunit